MGKYKPSINKRLGIVGTVFLWAWFLWGTLDTLIGIPSTIARLKIFGGRFGSMASLAVSLLAALIATVGVIWSHKRRLKPLPEWNIWDTVDYILNESKSAGKISLAELQKEIDQQALRGNLTVWARQGTHGLQEMLPSEFFSKYTIQFAVYMDIAQRMGAVRPPTVKFVDREKGVFGKETEYWDPAFSPRQVVSVWPPLNLFDKIRNEIKKRV